MTANETSPVGLTTLQTLRLVVTLSVLCLTAPALASAQEFTGTVLPGVSPDGQTAVVCTRLTTVPTNLGIPSGAQAFAGWLAFYPASGGRGIQALLVEPPNGKRPFVFLDVDRNGVLAATERFDFARGHMPRTRGQVRVALASAIGSPFSHLPVDIAIPSKTLPLPASPDTRYLMHSYYFLVSSKVRIDGREWYFRHNLLLDAPGVDPKNGYQALDTGRRVRFDTFSPHMGAARGEALIFRIGTRYVSTSALDLRLRRIFIQTRHASDYRHLELARGLAVPDFDFIDIDGRARRLSEFKGRFVLLNFWYPGCSPCSDELPFLKAALSHFGPRGLTVVGLSTSGQPEVLRAAIGVSDAEWVEADSRSVRRIVEEWFWIMASPSQVLLGPDGRILELGTYDKKGQSKLRGPQLATTLERTLR
jgi:thiol-disulfide isomerase/thioredoxin